MTGLVAKVFSKFICGSKKTKKAAADAAPIVVQKVQNKRTPRLRSLQDNNIFKTRMKIQIHMEDECVAETLTQTPRFSEATEFGSMASVQA